VTDLGVRLRAAREERGLGLRAAAEEIGVSFNSLSRVERGRDCLYSHALMILRWLDAPEPRRKEARPE
jgi:transcriptional regulator with XRE-family HTH domain